MEPVRFDQVQLPSLKGINQQKKIPWSEVLSSLTEWNVGRLRYRFTPKDKEVDRLDSPARTYAWAFYKESLIAAGAGYLIQKFNLEKVLSDITATRKLSEYAKKKGTICDINWRYLVDMHRLNDFLPYADESKFEEDIQDWVQRAPKHTWNGDEDEWYRRFTEEVNTLFLSSGKTPGEIMTVDEFVLNGDIWCTSGSGFEPDYREKIKIKNIDKDQDVTPTRSKWSVMWSLSKYKLKRLLFKKRYQVCKAVQKSEPGKVRAVISSDLSLYLKMTYCSLWFDQLLQGNTASTLWMSKHDRFMLWQRMEADGTWRMPLDQSEFDKNVTLRQVDIMVTVMIDIATKMSAPDAVIEIMHLIKYSLSSGFVFVNGKSIEIRNGILSGWRWTAFFDTIVNICELKMATQWVKEATGFDPGLTEFNAQGDDDWTKFKTRRGAIGVWLAYESFGLDVNPGKFFLDNRRDEYLRRVYDKGIVTGYPARSVTSILWRNPISEKEIVGAERCRSIFNKWKLYAERLDRRMDGWFLRQYKKDAIMGTAGMTNDILDNWLSQSVLMGGIGLDGGVRYLGEVPTTAEKTVDSLDLLQLPGFKEWSEYVKEIGVKERQAYDFAVQTMDFERSNRYPSWVKYIYTHDHLSISHIPYGLSTNERGTVALGTQAYVMAKVKGWRWFKGLLDLKSTTHYGKWGMEERSFKEPTFLIPMPVSVKAVKTFSLEPIKGYSITSCRLSSEPDLSFTNYKALSTKRKPTSWTRDFVAGRLKASVSPRTGWGMDAVGYLGDVLLNTAINIFLSANHGGLVLWDRLLASIDVTIPIIMQTLHVRIVE